MNQEADEFNGNNIDKDLALKMEQMKTMDMNPDTSDTGDMYTSVTSQQHEVCVNDGYGLVLTDLPLEVLIHIASFLESRAIIASLYRACKVFYGLFSDDRYWKTRISQRWSKPYPVVDRDEFNWCKACMEREEVHTMWSHPQEHLQHFMLRDGFFAAVDVVHLMKGGSVMAVGSRDRHLNVVDLSKYDDNKPDQVKDLIVASNTKSHKGWVWSMASYDDTLVTGSWDTYIRLWDLNGGDLRPGTEVKLKTAILGLYFEPNFIAAVGFDQRLYMLDPRAPDEIVKKWYHSKPILSVAADDKYVITGGEDNVVTIYDRTAGKKYKKIKVEHFILSMSYGDNQLWMGDKMGKLHVVDTRAGLFDEASIQTFDVGHNGRLTGVVHTDGGIFTCSSDSSIKVVEPNFSPGTINTLKCHSEEVAMISYNSGVLASAGADISVGVWLPNNRAF